MLKTFHTLCICSLKIKIWSITLIFFLLKKYNFVYYTTPPYPDFAKEGLEPKLTFFYFKFQQYPAPDEFNKLMHFLNALNFSPRCLVVYIITHQRPKGSFAAFRQRQLGE